MSRWTFLTNFNEITVLLFLHSAFRNSFNSKFCMLKSLIEPFVSIKHNCSLFSATNLKLRTNYMKKGLELVGKYIEGCKIFWTGIIAKKLCKTSKILRLVQYCEPIVDLLKHFQCHSSNKSLPKNCRILRSSYNNCQGRIELLRSFSNYLLNFSSTSHSIRHFYQIHETSDQRSLHKNT